MLAEILSPLVMIIHLTALGNENISNKVNKILFYVDASHLTPIKPYILLSTSHSHASLALGARHVVKMVHLAVTNNVMGRIFRTHSA